jgi:hypothetical protein
LNLEKSPLVCWVSGKLIGKTFSVLSLEAETECVNIQPSAIAVASVAARVTKDHPHTSRRDAQILADAFIAHS